MSVWRPGPGVDGSEACVAASVGRRLLRARFAARLDGRRSTSLTPAITVADAGKLCLYAERRSKCPGRRSARRSR
jgi:hypothetical protein